MALRLPLPIVNLDKATFECSFGRGCDGLCCMNGRPGLHPEELERIEANLEKFLPHLRPEALKVIKTKGFMTRRTRNGLPLVGVKNEWCLFFSQGCVLHKVGMMEGDSYRYKPSCCSLFPLLRDFDGNWYVRQSSEEWEEWKDLFCLDPSNSPRPAAESLREEILVAAKLESTRYGAAKKQDQPKAIK